METVSNNILIADDDRTNMMFMKKGVQNLPYNFVFVEDGTAALDMILNQNFDLLLLDVIMPGLSGFEVIEQYKIQRPDSNIPFLFLTGNDDKEAILKGFSLGAVDYITKPYSMQEIRKRITIHHDLYKGRIELDLSQKRWSR
ncbi:MAG: response regulator [Lentisphaeraceae bacterium]|nr:response regulator [Lentisphaeraceae bacterium]